MWILQWLSQDINSLYLVLFFRLDLDKWINDPPSESSEEEEEIDTIFDTPNEHKYDLRQLSKFSIIRQLYKMKVFSGSKLILV